MEKGIPRYGFWPKVDKAGDCWLWRGRLNNGGYGVFNAGGNGPRKAHRVAWELVNGPIAVGLFVLHHCDNRRCVRPEHLFIGTHADNMADMARKGRGGQRRGVAHYAAKLNEDQVREIKRALASGVTRAELARRYGMSHGAIHHISTGRSWASIQCEDCRGGRELRAIAENRRRNDCQIK